ncbi:hypothetical protein BGY98DRAFT_995716 [Russula aff. rugulosa BPL654]|nr:hypothetical protein BGY98DRAFT_995716 [Russula aff. rugulosa BPL654]
MAAAPIYNSQMSPDEYYRSPSPTTSLSPTLVNNARYTERPSLKLSFTSGASNILNSAVVDAANQTLYSISSNSKRTTMVSCRDNVEVATVQWDRHSPRMVFRRKKVKCKEWLKLAGPDNDSRILTLGDAQFTWMQGQGSASGHLIPANRPGLEIARWQIKSSTDEIILDIFQETAVEFGLLDSIVLSVVLLRSGYSFGDNLDIPVIGIAGSVRHMTLV